MQRLMVGLVALAVLAVGVAEAKGTRRGCGNSGGSGCGMNTAGCGQAVQYQRVTEWVTVTRQVCAYEAKTTEQEYTEVTFIPKEKKDVREETYYEQQTSKKKVKQVVNKMVSEKVKQ